MLDKEPCCLGSALTLSVLLVIGATKSIAVPIRITILPLNLYASALSEIKFIREKIY